MDSLRVTDDQSAAVAVAPRVSLDSIEAKIERELYFTAGEIEHAIYNRGSTNNPLDTFTLCIIVMTNGFVVIGESAPASPANYDKDLGRKFARENAIRKLWPLEGYALRERLSAN